MTVELKAIGGYAPGWYTCKCRDCLSPFDGDKRAYQCHPCATVSLANEGNTRTTPAPADLDRFELAYLEVGYAEMCNSPFGDYVLYDQAAALIANFSDAMIEELNAKLDAQFEIVDLKAKLAQIKAQVPVDVTAVREIAFEEVVHAIVLLKKTFSSEEYVENQPIGSISEIFACNEVLRSISALKGSSDA